METNKGNMGVMVAVIIILVIAAGALYMTSSLGTKTEESTTANTQTQEAQYAADDSAQLEADAAQGSGADDLDASLTQIDAELGVQASQ